jgi:hypothetical protein
VSNAQEFKDRVVDALVVAHIYRAEHDTDPQKALMDLLAWESKVALDPAVSEPARKLQQAPADLVKWSTELLRLYDHRFELARLEKKVEVDGATDRRAELRAKLRQYGEQKKVAWAALRDVLAKLK